MAAACRGVQHSLSRALTVAPASRSCCTISRKSSMQLCKPCSLSPRPAGGRPPHALPHSADLVQGCQTILVGQVRADPALEELADCKKGEMCSGRRDRGPAVGQHCLAGLCWQGLRPPAALQLGGSGG